MTDQEWIIGSAESCDLLVDAPTVSSQHCHLSRRGSQYFLVDCGSTNGTFCDGQPVTSRTAVHPASSLTLGKSFTMPWPDSAAAKQIVLIGRDPENDVVVDQPNISSVHARFMVGHNQTWVVEDLESTNGVSIDLRGVRHRVKRAIAVQPDDVVYFGSTAVPVRDLLAAAVNKPPRPLLIAPSASSTAHPSAARPTVAVDPQRMRALEQPSSAIEPQAAPRLPSANFGIWFLVGSLLSVLLYFLLTISGDRIKQSLGGTAAVSATPRADTPAADLVSPQPRTDFVVDSDQTVAWSPGTAAPEASQPAVTFPQAAEPPTPTEVAQSRLFWVLAAEPDGEPAFRLGVAWTPDGQRLVTTASVVDALASLDAQGLSRREVVHCASGRRFPIQNTGVHPQYASGLQRSRELETQYNALRSNTIPVADHPDASTASSSAAVSPGAAAGLAEQLKQIAGEELALRDRMVCYDVGWLTLENFAELRELATGTMAGNLPRARQAVSIASVGIDVEDPYYDATAKNTVLVVPARVHALVRPPDADIGRVEVGFEQPLSSWNVSGAPVLDESGRVIGMFVQPTSSLQDAAPEDVRTMADLALPAVIHECLQFAALSPETLP